MSVVLSQLTFGFQLANMPLGLFSHTHACSPPELNEAPGRA